MDKQRDFESKPDILVCFGKMLWNNVPDWFLESRLLKTIEIAKQYKDTPIILTGGGRSENACGK